MIYGEEEKSVRKVGKVLKPRSLHAIPRPSSVLKGEYPNATRAHQLHEFLKAQFDWKVEGKLWYRPGTGRMVAWMSTEGFAITWHEYCEAFEYLIACKAIEASYYFTPKGRLYTVCRILTPSFRVTRTNYTATQGPLPGGDKA